MTRNKKGFTLVELVIVIAVIAILAGVMIAVFSGVVRRANESAELQKVKNEEIAQKADDILKKIDNANWFSWEDFENSLAAKLTEVYKENASTTSTGITPEVLRSTLDEYFKNKTDNNTSLTEAQVKAIVENALAKASLGGVTENQVRTIVNTAVAGVNTVSKAQVQAIVDAAVAKGLTAADVAKAVKDAGLATNEKLTDVDGKVDTLIANLATLQSNALTKEQIETIIKTYLPVFVTVTSASDAATQAVALNSGSTINFSGMDDADVVIDLGTDYKTLYFNGKVKSFTVTAPNATIILNGEYVDVTAEAVAYNSLHINGSVKTLTIKKGRAVLEGTATVEKVIVEAETSKVVLEVAEQAKITEELKVEKSAGTVAVENKGTIQVVKAGETVKAGEAVVTNVDNGTVTNLAGSDDGHGDMEVIISDESGEGYKISVINQETLEAALVPANNGKVIVVDADFEVTTVEVPETINVTLDLNGHVITAALKQEGRHYYALDNYGILTIVDTVGGGAIEARGIENLEGATMTIESGRITAVDTNGGAAIWHEADAKLYINGGEFTATYSGPAVGNSGPGLLNSSGYTVITGGTFVSASVRCYAICVEGGETIIENVTVEGTHGALAADGGKLVVNGGTYTAKNYYGLYVSNDAGEAADATVNGGTFKGGSIGNYHSVHIGSDVNEAVNSTIIIKGGVFLNELRVQANVTEGNGAIAVSGGAFTYDTAKTNVPQFVVEGYTFDESTNTVVKK